MVQVRIRVAIVIPEIGLDEDPINPVMRDETVTKKKPNTSSSTAARTLPWVGIPGIPIMKMPSSSDPPMTIAIGRSRSVRMLSTPPCRAPNVFMLFRDDEVIGGVVPAGGM